MCYHILATFLFLAGYVYVCLSEFLFLIFSLRYSQIVSFYVLCYIIVYFFIFPITFPLRFVYISVVFILCE